MKLGKEAQAEERVLCTSTTDALAKAKGGRRRTFRSFFSSFPSMAHFCLRAGCGGETGDPAGDRRFNPGGWA